MLKTCILKSSFYLLLHSVHPQVFQLILLKEHWYLLPSLPSHCHYLSSTSNYWHPSP